MLLATDTLPAALATRIQAKSLQRCCRSKSKLRIRLGEDMNREDPNATDASCMRLLRVATEETSSGGQPVVVAAGGYKIIS